MGVRFFSCVGACGCGCCYGHGGGGCCWVYVAWSPFKYWFAILRTHASVELAVGRGWKSAICCSRGIVSLTRVFVFDGVDVAKSRHGYLQTHTYI